MTIGRLLASLWKAVKPWGRSEKNPQLHTSDDSIQWIFAKIGSSAKPELHDVNNTELLLFKPMGLLWKI